MIGPRNLAIPKNSSVLLDTNVLVDALQHGNEFQEVLKQLEALEANFLLSVVVRLEFLRGFTKLDQAQDFLTRWFGGDVLELGLDINVYEYVHDINLINLKQGNKSLKLGDLLISAQMARFSAKRPEGQGPILATQNHKDFPPALFDLKDVFNLQLPSGVIKTIGFYHFNPRRFTELKVA